MTEDLQAELDAAKKDAAWHEEHARRVEAELIPARARTRLIDNVLVELLRSPAGLFPEQLHALQRALTSSPRTLQPTIPEGRRDDPRWMFQTSLASLEALEAYAAQVGVDRDRAMQALRELLGVLSHLPGGLPLPRGGEAWEAYRRAQERATSDRARIEEAIAEKERHTRRCARCGGLREIR